MQERRYSDVQPRKGQNAAFPLLPLGAPSRDSCKYHPYQHRIMGFINHVVFKFVSTTTKRHRRIPRLAPLLSACTRVQLLERSNNCLPTNLNRLLSVQTLPVLLPPSDSNQ
ncbi:hypothetical protein ACOSQ2_020643 [Xanthoceras sorbifolium]